MAKRASDGARGGEKVFHTMESSFGGFSTQWKQVSGSFPHNGNVFSTVWKSRGRPGLGGSGGRVRRDGGKFGLGQREPILESHSAYFRVTLPSLVYGFDDQQLAAVSPVMTPVGTPVGKPSETLIDEVQRKVLAVLSDSVMSTAELAKAVGISQAKNMRRRYLRLLLDMRFVEYTRPHKPNSRLQKYRLTEKGRTWVGENCGTSNTSTRPRPGKPSHKKKAGSA